MNISTGCLFAAVILSAIAVSRAPSVAGVGDRLVVAGGDADWCIGEKSCGSDCKFKMGSTCESCEGADYTACVENGDGTTCSQTVYQDSPKCGARHHSQVDPVTEKCGPCSDLGYNLSCGKKVPASVTGQDCNLE